MSDLLGNIRAPWTPTQVDALNAYQRSGFFHPYTCGQRSRWAHEDGLLVATEVGWVCPDCPYTQDWALALAASFGTPGPVSRMIDEMLSD